MLTTSEDQTREGNIIAPLGCNLRMSMPEGARCRTCLHATDHCKSFKKRSLHREGRDVIYYCRGFENMPQQNGDFKLGEHLHMTQ